MNQYLLYVPSAPTGANVRNSKMQGTIFYHRYIIKSFHVKKVHLLLKIIIIRDKIGVKKTKRSRNRIDSAPDREY